MGTRLRSAQLSTRVSLRLGATNARVEGVVELGCPVTQVEGVPVNAAEAALHVLQHGSATPDRPAF
jgi:hypothetical protein